MQTARAPVVFANAAPITFVSHGMGLPHGVRFIGETSWVHVSRGRISAPDGNKLLKDPDSKSGKMPIKLPVSNNHTRRPAIRSKLDDLAVSAVLQDIEQATLIGSGVFFGAEFGALPPWPV